MYLALSLLFLISSQTFACGRPYSPFQLMIISNTYSDKVRGPTGQTVNIKIKEADFKFSKAMEQGDEVKSDSPFINYHSKELGELKWMIDPENDSPIAQELSIEEIKGYFKSNFTQADLSELGINSSTFIQKIEKSDLKKNFTYLSVSDFNEYPNISTEKIGDTSAKVRVTNALYRIFGADTALKMAEMIEKKNNDKKNVSHFSRKSYLSSDSLIKKSGQADLVLCASLSFSKEYYNNLDDTDEYIQNARKLLGIEAMRSSMNDYIASQALKDFNENQGKIDFNREYDVGGVKCKLSKSPDYIAAPTNIDGDGNRMRCFTAPQGNPIIRSLPTSARGYSDERIIQVGRALLVPKCKVGTNEVNLSKHIDYEQIDSYTDLMATLIGNLKSESLKEKLSPETASKLTKPNRNDLAFFNEVSTICNEMYLGKETKSDKTQESGRGVLKQ